MTTKLVAATFLAIAATAAGVGAQTYVLMRGSDTMLQLNRDVLAATAGSFDFFYAGTGSGAGENWMAANVYGHQTAAPMTRFLRAPSACLVAGGTQAEGLVVGLDAIVVAANTINVEGCGGVNRTKSLTVHDLDNNGLTCPGCTGSTGNTYTPTAVGNVGAWGDFLRVLFFGLHHDAAQTRNCDSDVRRALVADYTRIFQHLCGGGTCSNQGLHRLWRPNDASDVSQAFANLLGTTFSSYCNVGNTIPSSTPVGFSDFLDRDPIRVPCDGNGSNTGQQVCGNAAEGHAGTLDRPGIPGRPATLGLLLPIFLPSPVEVTYSAGFPVTSSIRQFPTRICDGESVLLPATKSNFSGMCPAGNESFGAECYTSVIRTIPGPAPIEAGFDANCLQVNTGTKCPFLFNNHNPNEIEHFRDCRGANLWPRNSDGSLMRDNSLTPAGRVVTGAFFRIYARATTNFPACTKTSATEQIGCLVGQADTCSMGIAGRPAVDPAGTAVALTVNQIAPDPDSLRKLITDPDNKYPLSRRLYYNSIAGFGSPTSLNNQEFQLAKYYANDRFMEPLLTSNGFVTLPLQAGHTSKVYCEDFPEEAPTAFGGCHPTGAGTGKNACLDNAALGLPTF